MFDWLRDALISFVLSFFSSLKALGDTMLNWIVEQAEPMLPDAGSAISATSIQEVLASVNYFIPLSELFVMFLAYAALWFLVWAYKVVKSWIPTVSS